MSTQLTDTNIYLNLGFHLFNPFINLITKESFSLLFWIKLACSKSIIHNLLSISIKLYPVISGYSILL